MYTQAAESPVATHAALNVGMQIILVHENDASRGGCEFAQVMNRTPEDLVDRGIYGTLAIEWRDGALRAVSERLVAKALGASFALSLRTKWFTNVLRVSHSHGVRGMHPARRKIPPYGPFCTTTPSCSQSSPVGGSLSDICFSVGRGGTS